jgi:hypothetical protein
MRYAPFNYEQISTAAGMNPPASVKSYNNKSFWFWCRALFQRATSVLVIKLPDPWEGSVRDFFLWVLFSRGYMAISKNDQFGLFFQPCTLTGFDFYYQPTTAIISNPQYQAELKIGSECEILKLTPDYFGIYDVIEYYAEKLSLLDNSINMGLINSKFAFMWAAKNKQAMSALEKMMDKINSGEPAVIADMRVLNDPTDKDLPFQIIDRGRLKESYLTTDQLQDFQTILNNFDAEIGIPSLPYYKKERLVADEAVSRRIDAQARSIVWYDTLVSSLDDVKNLYPEAAEIQIKLRYDLGEGEYEQGEDNLNRDV